MKTETAAFIYSNELERYHYPSDCPFKTERATMAKEMLESKGYYVGFDRMEVSPTPASREELLLYHTPEYIDLLGRITPEMVQENGILSGLGTEDNPVFPGLFQYATLAAGGTITGARLILDGKARIAFNPSGGYHHAMSDKAGGFCYINDVVLACSILANAGKKVMCVDIDAHHGNGTQDAFYRRNDVLTISFHESGKTLYPWGGFENEIGEGAGKGYNVNVPLPAGTDDDTFFEAYQQIVPPLFKAYDPDVIVTVIGMDILANDPLTHLKMTNNTVERVLANLLTFGRPILATGGGGYNLENTARGWALAWCTMCHIDFDMEYAGLGGAFLGTSELGGGLRDMRIYAQREERQKMAKEVKRIVEYLKTTVFPIHRL